MIWPLVILNLMLKDGIVVLPGADIKDEIVVPMFFFKIAGNILDRISVGFFDNVSCRESHGNDSVCDVGQIKILSLIGDGIFRASNNFLYNIEHQVIFYNLALLVYQECNKSSLFLISHEIRSNIIEMFEQYCLQYHYVKIIWGVSSF